MTSKNALDDNPLVEHTRRLPLKNSLPTRKSYSPSPQRSISELNTNITTEDDECIPKLIHRWNHKYSILSTIAFPNSGLLFCGTQDHQILVLDMVTFEKKQSLIGHTGSVLCLTKSADEKYLFSGGSDSLVKVWDVTQMKETHTIYSLVDIGDIFSLAWSSSLNTIYFGAQNASILFVHLLQSIPKDDPSGLPSQRFDKFFDSKGPTGDVHPLSHRKNNGELKSRLIEIPSSNIIPYAHNGFVYSMEINDRTLITGGGDGEVKIWDLNSRGLTLVKSLDNDESVLSLTRNESFLYCGLSDGQLKVWDLNTYQQIRSIGSDTNAIMSIAATSSCIYKGTSNGVIKWKFGKECKELWDAHQGSVLSSEICYRKGKALLITGGNDASVAIWEIPTDDNGPLRRASIAAVDNDSLLKTLGQIVSFKTVSKKPEYFIDESRRCAAFLTKLFNQFGADSEIIPVENGNPIVYGCFKGKESNKKIPRILWYGHYDVIEADDTSAWNYDPFKITATDGYLYGRGVSDNKGPILAAIYAVAELLQTGDLNADIVFLIEGEEECGSFGFQDAVQRNHEIIGDIDWVLLSNSYWLDENIPCLNYGLRGVISASVEINSDKPDRHSGVDGGVSREPTIDLVNLLSTLTTKNGTVQIPNFYEPIQQQLTPEEQRLYKEITTKADINISRETLLAKWKYPSLSIHKIEVSGPNNNTVIPRSSKASVSIRIVPEQNVEEIKTSFINYLESSFKDFDSDNQLKIKIVHESEPWLGDPTNSAFKILSKAVSEEWGIEPLYIREGGSIPSVRFLEKICKAPAAQIPCGQSTDNAHLNNEKLRVTNLYALRRILKKAFKELPSRSTLA
ncbi:putative WD repeat-containing protein [Wickerhamomyces ciferrii]|uniref:WD repeat-containing protein n=1 Tax=Wickerhamomyces ciferrii (strain ATCC 14091 / BCRC 22168 / CBS 111 / JCM 3599 / NBRC 0793 / NRRL Y-1031 F-60-10) TaxID=1206466 RepID=K0KSJ9_WICCF|nr:putative WD repeat-containing protein [Wickerhamomyces ciferrii]CCH44314.1 putative WD repeat-containing protein [Wickerhamomyces ciferrii]